VSLAPITRIVRCTVYSALLMWLIHCHYMRHTRQACVLLNEHNQRGPCYCTYEMNVVPAVRRVMLLHGNRFRSCSLGQDSVSASALTIQLLTLQREREREAERLRLKRLTVLFINALYHRPFALGPVTSRYSGHCMARPGCAP